MNLRSGRLKTEMTDEAAEYTSSLEFDKIIFEADIKTNFAHTLMLKEENIIDDEIADNILGALDQLKEDGYNELVFDPSVEDIHMAIENYVTDKIGPTAGFMHTAKSRNDQVATDVRLVLRDKITETQIGILEFMEGLVEKAGEHLETVFIGYTHLQHAQPITIAHHLMAHVQALKRDYERLEDTYKRVNLNPLGSAAMTTTSFPLICLVLMLILKTQWMVFLQGISFQKQFLIYLHYVQHYPKSVKSLFYGVLMNSVL